MGGMDPLGDIIGTSAGPVHTGEEINGQVYVARHVLLLNTHSVPSFSLRQVIVNKKCTLFLIS